MFLDQKLHVSAGSGYHQVLSFDSLKIILHNSRGGVFDEEISTSKPLLEHSTSILGVWVNHVIIHKDITLYYKKQRQNKEHEGLVLGKTLVVPLLPVKKAGVHCIGSWVRPRVGPVGFKNRKLPFLYRDLKPG